jgi:hypothetical protein
MSSTTAYFQAGASEVQSQKMKLNCHASNRAVAHRSADVGKTIMIRSESSAEAQSSGEKSVF